MSSTPGKLTSGAQESLLALICYDEKLCRAVLAAVPPPVFDPFFRDVAEQAADFIKRYRKPPGEHTLDLFNAIQARKKDAGEIYAKLYRSLQQTKDSINREYVLSQAVEFAEYQQVKGGITKALELLEQGQDGAVSKAKAVMARASKPPKLAGAVPSGILLNDHRQALSFLDEEEAEVFPTGIKLFDDHGLGPARKTLHLFMGLMNRGKSWWLMHLGKAALSVGRLRVFHATCEMRKESVARRYVQMFHSISKKPEAVMTRQFYKDELGRLDNTRRRSWKEKEIKRPSLQDEGIRKYLTERIANGLARRPPMWIEEYPTGSLTVDQLEADLDNLEASRGFIPDLILVDYADLMKLDSRYEREELSRIYKELRALAFNRNAAVATVTQSNREGLSAKTVKEKNASGDISKLFTADICLSYSQTEVEKELNLARIMSLKVREEQSRRTYLISQAYGIGQFCTDAVLMGNPGDYWNILDAEAESRREGDE